MNNATREVFGNIAPWMQVVFFVMIAASIGVLVWQVVAHVRLWRKGQSGGFERDWRVWTRRLIEYALAQKRVHKKSLGALLHLLLFSGFVVLTIGTTLLGIAHDGPYNFHHGWYYLIYELTMDVFGVAFCLGCLLAMYRRAFQRPASLGHNWRDWWLLGILLALGLTGFCGGSAPDALHPGAAGDCALVGRRLVDRCHDLARPRRAAAPKRCTSPPGGCTRFWSRDSSPPSR